MSWIGNLKTATKLSLGFGLMVVLLAIVVATAGVRACDDAYAKNAKVRFPLSEIVEP